MGGYKFTENFVQCNSRNISFPHYAHRGVYTCFFNIYVSGLHHKIFAHPMGGSLNTAEVLTDIHDSYCKGNRGQGVIVFQNVGFFTWNFFRCVGCF